MFLSKGCYCSQISHQSGHEMITYFHQTCMILNTTKTLFTDLECWYMYQRLTIVLLCSLGPPVAQFVTRYLLALWAFLIIFICSLVRSIVKNNQIAHTRSFASEHNWSCFDKPRRCSKLVLLLIMKKEVFVKTNFKMIEAMAMDSV